MSGDTRERILTVANELFTEQGYEGTSLREISDRLGITKAALYYHFPSKDDILGALIEPMFATARELMDRLEAAADVYEWADALEWTLDAVFEHRDFFRLVQRNRNSFEQVSQSFEEMRDHLLLHERLEKSVHAIATDVRQEIRMVAALAALTGFDDWAPTLLAEAPPDVLREELSATIFDALGLPRRPVGPVVDPAGGQVVTPASA